MNETVVVGLARLSELLKTYLIFLFLVTCLLCVCEGVILFLLLFVLGTGSCYVAQTGLKHSQILLPQVKVLDSKQTLPWSVGLITF